MQKRTFLQGKTLLVFKTAEGFYGNIFALSKPSVKFGQKRLLLFI